MKQKQLELERKTRDEVKEFRDSLEQDRTWRLAVTRATLNDEIRSGMQVKLNVYVAF